LNTEISNLFDYLVNLANRIVIHGVRRERGAEQSVLLNKRTKNGVSVDQIVSAQPGLIPQMSGFLTNKQLWECTTFVDHVSNFVSVHFMIDLTLSEILLATAAWENVLAQAGHTVKHYHTDNGRFTDNGFINTVNPKLPKDNVL